MEGSGVCADAEVQMDTATATTVMSKEDVYLISFTLIK